MIIFINTVSLSLSEAAVPALCDLGSTHEKLVIEEAPELWRGMVTICRSLWTWQSVYQKMQNAIGRLVLFKYEKIHFKSSKW